MPHLKEQWEREGDAVMGCSLFCWSHCSPTLTDRHRGFTIWGEARQQTKYNSRLKEIKSFKNKLVIYTFTYVLPNILREKHIFDQLNLKEAVLWQKCIYGFLNCTSIETKNKTVGQRIKGQMQRNSKVHNPHTLVALGAISVTWGILGCNKV